MNWKSIFVVYLKELKDQLRDRRTIISTIVIPTVLMPLMFFGVSVVMKKVITKAQDEGTSVMVVGAAGAPQLMSELQADKKFRVLPEKDDYKQRIADKKMRVALELPENFEARLQKGEAVTASILHYEGEIKSGIGARELDSFLQKYRTKLVAERLTARGLPPELVKPYDIRRQNVAPPEKVGGAAIGGLIPYIIIILCFVGAMYPAMDLTAGEKERGTMETLMCSPTSRINIVLGKFLTVVTASAATMVFSLVSMGATAALGGSFLTSKPAAVTAGAATKSVASAMPTIDPAGVLGLFAMILPVAVLFAAILLTVSLFAKSYKEAQSYVGPLIMVVILPAMFGMLPGIDLNLKTALVPILNLSLVSKEMLSGTWNWDFIAIIFGSTCVYAAVALALCVKMFNREDVMFRA
ncbi:ABC transporter permease [Oleiharenicola lentus]|uniref:ABC transporter permease n=1 Tax=Oleiharenicola lentus TaxID=2508720 RepID=UPI003F681666